jgi:hypothetical protein
MDGIAAVEARIQQIMSQFAQVKAGGVLGTSDSGTTPTGGTADSGSFAAALAQAQGGSGVTGLTGLTGATTASADVPTSSGTLNRAGVDSVQWARDFLTKVGMPITSENVRAVSAWEQAEGTKASFNPLATTQSGFAGETRFNSVGVKNYATYQDGIDANAHAILNGRYPNVLDALRKGDDAMAVARAIADSPWGTHEGVLRVLQSQ